MALNKKGQISIEFILIVTIAFAYIGATVLPIATDSAQAAFDVKAVADTKLSATKIANALNEAASSSGDMKKTISIVLPEKALLIMPKSSRISFDVSAAEVKYEVWVTGSGGNPDEINCPVDKQGPINPVTNRPEYYACSSSIPLVTNAITPFIFTGPTGSFFHEVIVEKTGGTIKVS